MFPRLLLLTLALACAGCDILDLLGIDPNETLELPRPALDRRLWKNSLEDPQHLAGLRVELTSSVNRTFTAEDLPVRPFGIAARGQVIADVGLRRAPKRRSVHQFRKTCARCQSTYVRRGTCSLLRGGRMSCPEKSERRLSLGLFPRTWPETSTR